MRRVSRSVFRSVLVAALLAVASLAVAQDLPLKTVEFNSPSVGRTLKYNIVLPRGYESSTTRYPVLYLLHGLTQNYTVWGLQNSAPFYTGLYDDLIVVMLDGGNSWYVNWASSQGGQKNNWADYVVKDAIGHIDGTYRTIARREGRAIAGLSMGGFGAIVLGLRHPDLFVSIGSTSGALEHARQAGERLRGTAAPPASRPAPTPEEQAAAAARRRQPNPLIGIAGFNSQEERTPLGQEFAKPEDADAFDPFKLIHQVPKEKMPHVYLDCGTEDRLIAGARALARILEEKNVPFNYMQMAGAHNSAYWTQSIGHIMSVQYEVMARALGRRPEPKAARGSSGQ
jgi:S-formylglutathione hydrolase FrmB